MDVDRPIVLSDEPVIRYLECLVNTAEFMTPLCTSSLRRERLESFKFEASQSATVPFESDEKIYFEFGDIATDWIREP